MGSFFKPIPILIFLISFGVTYTIEKVYDRYHLLDQYNTIFDADVALNLDSFGNGWGLDGFRHPFGGRLFSTPIRAVTKVLSKVGLGEDLKLRRELALLIVPIAEGIKSLLLYLIFRMLRLTLVETLAVLSVNLCAFSTLTIGSIPETYPLSSMFITLFAWLMVRGAASGQRTSDWHWIVSGILAIGITITNLVPFSVFYLLSKKLRGDAGIGKILVRTAVVGSLSLIITFSVASAGAMAYSVSPTRLLPISEAFQGNSTDKTQYRLGLIIAVGNTISGIIPSDIVPNEDYVGPVTKRGSGKATVYFRTTNLVSRLKTPLALAWIAIFGALLLLGAYQAYRQAPIWGALAISSVGLLIFNFLLHQFFYGTEMFLYALHWQVSMVFLLAGLVFLGNRKIFGICLLMGLVIISIFSASHFIGQVISAAESKAFTPVSNSAPPTPAR